MDEKRERSSPSGCARSIYVLLACLPTVLAFVYVLHMEHASIAELQDLVTEQGSELRELRQQLAEETFARTSRYRSLLERVQGLERQLTGRRGDTGEAAELEVPSREHQPEHPLAQHNRQVRSLDARSRTEREATPRCRGCRKGDHGDTGARGPRGDRGYKGATGYMGRPGPAGHRGSRGHAGRPGKSLRGEQGPRGPSGNAYWGVVGNSKNDSGKPYRRLSNDLQTFQYFHAVYSNTADPAGTSLGSSHSSVHIKQSGYYHVEAQATFLYYHGTCHNASSILMSRNTTVRIFLRDVDEQQCTVGGPAGCCKQSSKPVIINRTVELPPYNPLLTISDCEEMTHTVHLTGYENLKETSQVIMCFQTLGKHPEHDFITLDMRTNGLQMISFRRLPDQESSN